MAAIPDFLKLNQAKLIEINFVLIILIPLRKKLHYDNGLGMKSKQIYLWKQC